MASVRCEPLRRYGFPYYPTKLQSLAEPDLLRKHLPRAWLNRAELAGAAGALLAVNLAGCSDKAPPASGGGEQSGRLKCTAVVAPVFQHGKGTAPGRGAMGCIAVAAPAFLSEEEALQIITEELARAGVHANQRGVEMPSIIIVGKEIDYPYDWTTGQHEVRVRNVPAPLALDAWDGARHIGVEYVSHGDFGPLGGDDSDSWTMDLKQVASSVAAEVHRQGPDMRFGVFYDPVRYYSFFDRRDRAETDENGRARWANSEEQAIEDSKQMLREQVKDFADWLKAQGVI